MSVRLVLPNAIINNISDFEIKVGQTFTLDASSIEPKVLFLESNDPILNITYSGNKAIIKAIKVGGDLIFVKADGIETITIKINVYADQAIYGSIIEVGTGLKSDLTK